MAVSLARAESLAHAAAHAGDETAVWAWADWLGEQADPVQSARGEFVRVQTLRAAMSPTPGGSRWRALSEREELLLASYQLAWLAEWLGPGCRAVRARFHRGGLEFVDLSGQAVAPAVLERLARCPSLRRLSLANCPIDDTHLLALCGAKGLERLDLRWTQVTDQGLAALAELPRLFALTIEGSLASQAGLDRSKALRRKRFEELPPDARRRTAWGALEVLIDEQPVDPWGRVDCRECPVTDNDLAYLAALPEITEILLAERPITATGLARLASLPRLRALDVSETGLDDLAVLARFPALRSLTAENLPLGEQAPRQFEPLGRLEHLRLTGSLWPEHLEPLAQALPATTIDFEPKRYWV